MMLYNPTIFDKRPVAMQRMADAVVNGYTQYVSGAITIDRCAHLVNKFDLNYRVSADRNERARRKRAGLGNSTLILWLHNGIVYWWLFVTEPEAGHHAAHSIEKLLDANSKDGRIEIEGFELVRVSKKSPRKQTSLTSAGQQPAKLKSTPSTSLTWRMSRHKYQAWRDSVVESVRGASVRLLELLIYQLWSSPGFSGIRSQIGNIATLYRNEVKRSGRKDAPTLPKKLGYVRRLTTQGIKLSELVVQHKMQSTKQHLPPNNTDIDVQGLTVNSGYDVAEHSADIHAL